MGRPWDPEVADRPEALVSIMARIHPATTRQAHYQAIVAKLVEKDESGYDKVQRELVLLRRNGTIPYGAIADNTHWQRKPKTYRDISHVLQVTARLYRRDLWAGASAYVEIWVEKDALSDVLYPVTVEYDLPLILPRGYSSITFLQETAEYIEDLGVSCYLYHLRDLAPSGWNAGEKIEETLRELAPNTEVHFQHIAVTPEQINTSPELQEAARPLKRKPNGKWADTRTAAFLREFVREYAVELDAIDPNILRQLVHDCIERQVDHSQLETLKVAESSERERLLRLVNGGAA